MTQWTDGWDVQPGGGKYRAPYLIVVHFTHCVILHTVCSIIVHTVVIFTHTAVVIKVTMQTHCEV